MKIIHIEKKDWHLFDEPFYTLVHLYGIAYSYNLDYLIPQLDKIFKNFEGEENEYAYLDYHIVIADKI